MTHKYEDFATKHLDITNISGPEAMCRCIVHDDTKASMQFNLDSGLWVCFSGDCQSGGSFKRLLHELGIENFHEPEPDIFDLQRKVRLLNRKQKEERSPVKEESYLTRFNFPTNYWTGRGFTKETIAAFELGYDPMEDAVTIPMRNALGQLIGVTHRYLDPDVELRYHYPMGFKRSLNLFGSWLAEHHHSDTAVLVEGAVDAMKVWQAGFIGLAQYGSSISATQIRILRRIGIRQVVLFYDDDKAGRKATLCAQGMKFHRRKGVVLEEYVPALDLRRDFLVRSINYVAGSHSDPGGMNTRMIKKHVANASSVI